MKMKQKTGLVAVYGALLLSLSVLPIMPSDVVTAQGCTSSIDPNCDPSSETPVEETPAPKEEEEDKCEGEDCCGGVKTSIINDDTICNETGEGGVILGLLKWVLKIMTAGVGVAAVGGIAWGALLYTTAESKPEQTKKAIGIITNVVIGLVAYALMGVFLNFLIPGGIFG